MESEKLICRSSASIPWNVSGRDYLQFINPPGRYSPSSNYMCLCFMFLAVSCCSLRGCVTCRNSKEHHATLCLTIFPALRHSCIWSQPNCAGSRHCRAPVHVRPNAEDGGEGVVAAESRFV